MFFFFKSEPESFAGQDGWDRYQEILFQSKWKLLSFKGFALHEIEKWKWLFQFAPKSMEKWLFQVDFTPKKIEKWKRLFQSEFCTKIVVEDEICSIRIIQESLKGVKGVRMQDGNSVETLHWVKLVNHYIWGDNTSLLIFSLYTALILLGAFGRSCWLLIPKILGAIYPSCMWIMTN